MGMLAVVELAGKVESGTMSLIDAISQHLSTGFVKPVRAEWAFVCVGIIKKYKGGDHNLSYDIQHPTKPNALPLLAQSLVEDLHLDAFIGELNG